jgi:hypothetical protein
MSESETVEWFVLDHDNDNRKPAATREDAEDMATTAREFGSENVEIVRAGDRDDPPESEVVAEARPADQSADVVADREETEAELIDRGVTDDPITWLERSGDHFVDYVGERNTPAINRKGFEVLSHFYEIDIQADLQVPPEETDFQFCRVKATATTPEDRECQAFGSAHIDRGDNPELLLEMADTRARKRALSIATGVGAVAVSELKSEVPDA